MVLKRMYRWQLLTMMAAFAVILALLVPAASADGQETFKVMVAHKINGEKLGLSQELPVIAIVERNGEVLAEIPLKFREKFQGELPAGNYLIQIKSVELDAIIDTMTVGPVDIAAGSKVSLVAKLDRSMTPIVDVKVKDARPPKPEPPKDDTFKVLVKHGINGEKLGLSKELPVIAIVQRNGEVIAEIPLEFKETFQGELPAGNYLIQIKSVELDTIIDSMTVGPVDIPGGVKVRLLATLDDNMVPIVDVMVR